MSIVIRQSVDADIPAIFAMLKEFTIFQQTPEKLLVTEQQMREDKELFKCFVAEDILKETLVGYVCYSFVYYSWIGKSIYLDDLYVKASFRGHGAGSRLINTVIDIAKETNCKKVRWQVSKWNTNAQLFYKKLGAVIDETEINCDLII